MLGKLTVIGRPAPCMHVPLHLCRKLLNTAMAYSLEFFAETVALKGQTGRRSAEGIEIMEKQWRIIAAFEACTGVGIILFWIGFFTTGLAPADAPQCYFAYEHAFPLPDSILALALITSAIIILKGRPSGRKLSLICAGSLMFLGVLDFSFNILNGVYALSVPDLFLNAFINIWCAGFGLFISTRSTRPA
jgi:hypothetical protein